MDADLRTWLKGRVCSALVSVRGRGQRTKWWPLRGRGVIWEVGFRLRDGHPASARTGTIDLISGSNLQALSGSPRPAAVIPPDPRRYAPTHSLRMLTFLVAFRPRLFVEWQKFAAVHLFQPGRSYSRLIFSRGGEDRWMPLGSPAAFVLLPLTHLKAL